MAGTAPIADLCPEALLLHQAIDPVFAATLTNVPQIVRDFAIAIDTSTFQPELLDQAKQPLIFPQPMTTPSPKTN